MEKLKVALCGIAFVHGTLQGYDILEVFLIFACNIEKEIISPYEHMCYSWKWEVMLNGPKV